jgi:hypothetical protein
MARSTQAQKAQRLNAAYRLLEQRMSMAEAAMLLAREEVISLRHAYRYLEAAAKLKRPVAIGEPALPITFKLPGNVIRALRSYAAKHDLTLSEVVARAITELVARVRRHV